MKTTTTLAGALRALHEARTPHFSDAGAPQLFAIIGTDADLGALTDAADQLEAQLAATEAAPAAGTSAAAIAGMVRVALGEHQAEQAAADAALDDAIDEAMQAALDMDTSHAGLRTDDEFTAPGVLRRAAGHISARARTYDRPEGERSAGAAAAAFNAITGRTGDRAMSEPEAWLFLQCLKQVRLFQREGYHADSAEDNVAYGALLAEAKAREGDELMDRQLAALGVKRAPRPGELVQVSNTVTSLGQQLRAAVARRGKEGGAS